MDKKPVVSQAAMEYYEFYKDTLTSFAEWFEEDLEDSPSYFEKEKEVQKWLYDVDYETQKQRELALATLIVNGPEAVEVEKEKLYTVELPNPNGGFGSVILLRNNEGKIYISFSFFNRETWRGAEKAQLTEAEIKKDFDWAWEFAEEVDEWSTE